MHTSKHEYLNLKEELTSLNTLKKYQVEITINYYDNTCSMIITTEITKTPIDPLELKGFLLPKKHECTYEPENSHKFSSSLQLYDKKLDIIITLEYNPG